MVLGFYFIFFLYLSRFSRSHENDIYLLKYFHTLAVVFQFTSFGWAFYPVTCRQEAQARDHIFAFILFYTGECGRGVKVTVKLSAPQKGPEIGNLPKQTKFHNFKKRNEFKKEPMAMC